MKLKVATNVNGRRHEHEVEPRLLLVHHLRDNLGLTGTHIGCDTSHCGACTVLLDGRPVKSCTVFAVQTHGREITTVEGLGTADNPGPLQQAFIDEQAAQCGYCIAGMIMRAQALLEANASPDDDEIRRHMMPNLCRCGTHLRVLRAIKRAAKEIGART